MNRHACSDAPIARQALAGRLLLPVSKDTIQRSLRRETEPTACKPPVIGIDDWAWRRGERNGRLICDLERRQVIDLLPDREPATVEADRGRGPR